eukprot:symbB.v1.2.015755.t1/scaffold1187.1/size155418/4
MAEFDSQPRRPTPKLKIAGFANAVANAENGMQTFRRLNGSGRVQNLVKRYETRGTEDPSERPGRSARSSGSANGGLPSQVANEDGPELPSARAHSADSCRSQGASLSLPSMSRARSQDSALQGDFTSPDVDLCMELSSTSRRTAYEEAGLSSTSRRTAYEEAGIRIEAIEPATSTVPVSEGNANILKEPFERLPLPTRPVVAETAAPRRRWRCCQCFERFQPNRESLLGAA